MRASVPSTLPKVYPSLFWKALGVLGYWALSFFDLPLLRGEEGILQPVPFSHRVHAGSAKLPCAACHRETGPLGRDISIPPVSACLGCHRTVAAGRPAIRQLAALGRAGKRVDWEPVWFLPDFVWFSHRRHAKAAGCAVCHGAVEQREVLWREVETNMKFCRACHVRTGAKAICGTCHLER